MLCWGGQVNAKFKTVGIWVNNRREEGDEENMDYQRGIVYYISQDNR